MIHVLADDSCGPKTSKQIKAPVSGRARWQGGEMSYMYIPNVPQGKHMPIMQDIIWSLGGDIPRNCHVHPLSLFPSMQRHSASSLPDFADEFTIQLILLHGCSCAAHSFLLALAVRQMHFIGLFGNANMVGFG